MPTPAVLAHVLQDLRAGLLGISNAPYQITLRRLRRTERLAALGARRSIPAGCADARRTTNKRQCFSEAAYD